jgi:hypothetical protein
MLIRLPLPYIRPLGSKCFAGGYSTLAVRAGSYWNRNHGRPPASTPSTEVRLIPSDILCSKQAKRKNSNPASSGSSLTTDPFDWTRGQSNSQPPIGIYRANCPHWLPLFNDLLGFSVDLFWPNRPRRGGRVAECGGLLILPDPFAQTDFHVFCSHYRFLSCSHIPSFAIYSSASS